MKYKPSPDFLVTVITLALFGAAVLYLCGAIWFWQSAVQAEELQPEDVTQSVTFHLPTKCAEFYNNGTDEWVNCMGVGYK